MIGNSRLKIAHVPLKIETECTEFKRFANLPISYLLCYILLPDANTNNKALD